MPDEVGDDELGTWFVKPRDSQAFVQRFGVKGFRLTGRDDAETRLAAAAEAGLAVLLQEYVPGPPDTHYFVDGYVALDGRPLAFFARRRLRMYPPDFGNSTYHVSVPLDEVGDAVAHLSGACSPAAVTSGSSAPSSSATSATAS